MKQLQLLSLLFACAFLFSCGGAEPTPNDTPDNPSDNPPESTVDVSLFAEKHNVALEKIEAGALRIQDLYATSTDVPLSKYHISNAFDGDPETFYKTMDGAYANEGIMIYFSEAVGFDDIKISTKEGEFYVQDIDRAIFVNGIGVEQVYNFSNNIRSLFIRFNGGDDSDLLENDDVDEYEEEYVINYDLGKSIAITEIEFYKNKEKLEVVAPIYVNGKIEASSTLEPEVAFASYHLSDGRRDVAWAEGKEEEGIGEKFTVQLYNAIMMDEFALANGYQRSPVHFGSNSRVKELKLNKSSNSESTVFEVKDDNTWQVFPTEETQTDQIEFTVNDVYPGSSYTDLVISELSLGYKGVPIKIIDDSKSDIIAEVKRTAPTVLSEVLDRPIVHEFRNEADGGFNKRFVLRSDHTFVYYNDELCGQNCVNISEGNWTLVEDEGDKVVVEIFGRYFNPDDAEGFYKGKMNWRNVKIFKEKLSITDVLITGGKYVNNIKRSF